MGWAGPICALATKLVLALRNGLLVKGRYIESYGGGLIYHKCCVKANSLSSLHICEFVITRGLDLIAILDFGCTIAAWLGMSVCPTNDLARLHTFRA